MKKLLLVLFVCIGSVGVGEAKLNIVATTPDLGAIAREVGGSRVTVTVLAKATEDPHFVDAKPSHIVTLNRADAIIEGGAELEVGWLPPLLNSARNSKLAMGAPGRIVVKEGMSLLEIPNQLDRSLGDIHPLGNPHFLVDPINAKIAALNIANALIKLDMGSADAYKSNLEKFQTILDVKIGEWQKLLSSFKGAKIVTYHKDMTYFAHRFELEVIDTLEPLPGVPPTASHLAEVIKKMKAVQVKVILVQPFQNRRTAETIASHTGAKVVDFPLQPGAAKTSETYFQWMDYLVNSLASALGGKQ